jgi:hypothetical protein
VSQPASSALGPLKEDWPAYDAEEDEGLYKGITKIDSLYYQIYNDSFFMFHVRWPQTQ